MFFVLPKPTFFFVVFCFFLHTSNKTGSLEKYMALIQFSEVNIQFLEELLARKVGGLLIILPQDLSARGVNKNNLAKWQEFERDLFQKELNFQIPIYFALDDPVF